MDKKTRVIMTYGYPATGKTFISNKLEASLQDKYTLLKLSTLDFRKKFNLFDLYSNSQRELIYDYLSKEVKKIVEARTQDILILDGNFNAQERRKQIYLSLNDPSDLYIIKCDVQNEEVIKKRILSRKNNPQIYENKADDIKLYTLIKNTGDDVMLDEIVEKKHTNIIYFESDLNLLKILNLNSKSVDLEITKDILEAIRK